MAYQNRQNFVSIWRNMEFKRKKFSMPEVDVDAVYLSEKEVIDLYNFKFDNNRLEQVNDLFVFGCFTGLQFSDYSIVEKENIVKSMETCFSR